MSDVSARLFLSSPVAIWALASLLSCADVPEERPRQQTAVRIFAASSLIESFTVIAKEFEARNPTVDLQLTFAGSQILSLQIEHGADAHLFASADELSMNTLQTRGLVSAYQTFAHNRLTLVVPANNPASIQQFDDLDHAQRLVVGNPYTPIGRYTHQLITSIAATKDRAFADRIRSRIVSEEGNTRLVRAKVELGEADAAIIYRTDAAEDTQFLRTIQIPESLNPQANYVISEVSARASGSASGPASRASQGFINYLLSSPGQASLTRQGFLSVVSPPLDRPLTNPLTDPAVSPPKAP